mmetsp:Transcript_20175/g.48008  ORF Transcript_20175/g.48008 Transcript_20175/m.48008 type:complete len:116 (-) Transcript_20175:24-371(-)
MATAAAVERLKNGVNAALRTALETPPTGEQLSLARQEELAKETIDAAKEVDSLFEKVKLSRSEESAEDVQREIEDLQALLAAKDDLLKRSLDNVSAWEAKFAQLRESQKALTFNT